MPKLIMETNLNLPNRRQGKVRDLYDVELPDGEQALLIVATDRVSAFDVVLANGPAGKGIVLTQLSKFWFERFGGQFDHHLISTDAADVPGLSDAEREQIAGRMMLCRRTRVLPVECIARGYLAGSGWKDYQRNGQVCGIDLPPGLRNGDRLPEPLFTPSTKADTGHDENISFAQAAASVGEDTMQWLKNATLRLYELARDHALTRGIVLADTKFEFGVLEQNANRPPLLIDEIFTPDSSRFWPADAWRPGEEQPSFDKQYVREHLETLVAASRWDKTSPGPALPEAVLTNTMSRYLEAYRRLTGTELAFQAP